MQERSGGGIVIVGDHSDLVEIAQQLLDGSRLEGRTVLKVNVMSTRDAVSDISHPQAACGLSNAGPESCCVRLQAPGRLG